MNNIKYALTLLVIIAMALHACREDVDEFIPYNGGGVYDGNVDKLLEELRPDQETFTIRDDRLVIRTDYGTMFTFPEFNFVDNDGNKVNANELRVEIIEIHEPGDMILFGTPTITHDNRLLESAGEYHISIWNGNQRVFLPPGTQMQMQIPDDNPVPGMELFYDDDENPENFSWRLAANTPAQSVWQSEWWVDSTLVDGDGFWDFGYEMFSDSLGWINCDKFYDIPPDDKTDICIDLPDGFDSSNTNAYIVFNNLTSMTRMSGDPQREMFCMDGMPIAMNITIVVVSEQDEEVYYLGMSTLDITSDLVEVIEPVETSIDDIEEVLGQL